MIFSNNLDWRQCTHSKIYLNRIYGIVSLTNVNLHEEVTQKAKQTEASIICKITLETLRETRMKLERYHQVSKSEVSLS